MALASALSELEIIESTGRATDAGVRGRTHTGLPVDLKIVAPDQFGNLLQHFTGSKQHNMAMREAAVRKGLHVSEYGILDDASGETWRCATEEEVYERLGLPVDPPELREGRGELDAAARGDLPELVTEDDLRGELHAHTTASDGRATLEEMAFAARERGFEYLAITDHSATHGFGNEVSPDQLRKQIEKVHALNERLDGIELLAGSEVNILPDGAPDYDDDLLAELDWVIGSVHTSFRMAEKAMTDRIVAAIEHPLIDAIGHPTGRKIESRAPYAFDMERVIEAAARTGTMIEINASRTAATSTTSTRGRRPQAGVLILVEHRRPLDRRLRVPALGNRDGAARVADPRPGGQHAVVAGVRGAAEAGFGLSGVAGRMACALASGTAAARCSVAGRIGFALAVGGRAAFGRRAHRVCARVGNGGDEGEGFRPGAPALRASGTLGVYRPPKAPLTRANGTSDPLEGAQSSNRPRKPPPPR